MTERKAKSPYQRYGKKPWVYSPMLQQIIKARKDGQHDVADALAVKHSRQYHLNPVQMVPALDVVLDEMEEVV